MLYKGNMEQISRRGQQEKSAKVYNRKHNHYCNTRCICMTQEEQSAIPAGVFNADEDSDDEDAYLGEQKELQTAKGPCCLLVHSKVDGRETQVLKMLCKGNMEQISRREL